MAFSVKQPIRCPRCSGPLSTEFEEPALSRADNETSVCSSCGVAEAFFTVITGKPVPAIATGRITFEKESA